MFNKIACAFLSMLVVHTVWADPGIGVVMDSKGNVFYTDLAQVWKIDTAGNKSIAVPNVHTHELYIDANDNLYGEHLWYEGEATNKWGHYVWKRSASGTLEKIIPDTEGFLTNYSFVRDHWGRMYWVDRSGKCSKIIRKNKDGSILRLGNECGVDMGRVTCAWNGSLYYIDNFSLKKIDIDGRVTNTLVKQLVDQQKAAQLGRLSVMNLWTDRMNNVYVAIFSEGVVKKISPRLEVSVAAASPEGWAPTSGLVDIHGNLWIMEYSPANETRIRKISEKGVSTVY